MDTHHPAADVEYLALDDAVREYGIPKTTLWRHFKKGLVEGIKVAGRIHLRRSSLERAAASAPNSTHSPPYSTPTALFPEEPLSLRDLASSPPSHASPGTVVPGPHVPSDSSLHGTPPAARRGIADSTSDGPAPRPARETSDPTLHRLHSTPPDETEDSISRETQHSTSPGMPHSTSTSSPVPRDVPSTSSPVPRDVPPAPSAFQSIREIHELAIRLDDLHRELRRTDRENAGLRFELQRHRHALEANATSLQERENRAREAEILLSERDLQQTRQIAELQEARDQAEARAHDLAETHDTATRTLDATRAHLDQALAEAEQARKDAQAARTALAEAQRLLDAEKALPWWKRLLRR